MIATILNPMTIFAQISLMIIREQALVIGPLAWDEARKVSGLQIINMEKGEVNIEGSDPRGTVDNLVAQYERIFGKASREVCKDAVKSIISSMSTEEVPESLR